ncbi:hypothetical protein HanXRQr2_Chr06g0270251 [Helianthus annuus]|uniref:Uncharacterized protein n=1 Tax=Helianthus annuus TaxID=4232 RepID=A0A9K3IWE0_HELAN|nr:hypothetical protein HanXRQr2_Chr06g0270251 [Helianthus annuus]KAJ0916368.1 hypothetical protein HanPSC8_Chr06g0260841 [Helianthus annuus]
MKISNTSPNQYFLFPHSSISDDTRTRFIERLNHKIAATELPCILARTNNKCVHILDTYPNIKLFESNTL